MLPPSTVADPDVGEMRPASMRIVVVLPDPFGPTKPTTSPAGTSKLSPSTATTSPKRFDNESAAIAIVRGAVGCAGPVGAAGSFSTARVGPSLEAAGFADVCPRRR